MKLLEIIIMGFNIMDQLLISFIAFVRYWRKYGSTMRHLFVDFKKAYDSVRREVLYSILIEFGVPMIVARLIKICISETCIGKHLSGKFTVQNGQGRCFSAITLQLALGYDIRKI
jgi:hypothetical protein